MSITSRLRPVAILSPLFSLLLAGCFIQGPWDYTPSQAANFRGIWASAYAVADKPAQNVCFERLLELTQGHSDAFPFYDSATVGIEGNFEKDGAITGQSLPLQPLTNTPNCFSGDTSVHFVKGQDYQMTSRFIWDSAGSRVTSTLTATAHVPTAFHVSDTAMAPSVAFTGLGFSNDLLNSFKNLPPDVQGVMALEYGDTLTKLQSDSVALAAYLKDNGAKIFARLAQLLQGKQQPYLRDATLFYIGGPSQLNNLSHYFHSIRSDDVQGVLVTQYYDTNGARPITSFDVIAGIKPDTGKFYYPGDHHRLLLLPSAEGAKGYNVLDSIGVVNAWYWTGLNRLYFYGVEKAYTDFAFTTIQTPGDGPGSVSPKIQQLTNVKGGKGFFAGMVADSFDVNIQLDPTTQAYSYPAARAFACRDKGWFDSRDCAGWYHTFCSDNQWARSDCRLDAIMTCADSAGRASAPAGVCQAASDSAARDSLLAIEALTRYCIDKNYPADFPGCSQVRQECESGGVGNGCQLILWKSCDLNYWKPQACVAGRESYCQLYGDVQVDICRGVKNP